MEIKEINASNNNYTYRQSTNFKRIFKFLYITRSKVGKRYTKTQKNISYSYSFFLSPIDEKEIKCYISEIKNNEGPNLHSIKSKIFKEVAVILNPLLVSLINKILHRHMLR